MRTKVAAVFHIRDGKVTRLVAPVWPTKVRVTIGSKEEMAKFKEAFAKVWA